MLNRLFVAVILVPLTIVIFLYGDFSLLILANLIIGTAMFEVYNMFKNKGKELSVPIGMIWGILIPNVWYLSSKGLLPVKLTDAISVLAIITILSYRVVANKVEKASEYIMYTALGVFYVSFLFSHIIGIKFLPNGNKWVITIQVLVWISDTFAYLVGMRIGRKFFKRGLSMVSPKKSIEGSIGSFVFTIIMMLILRFTLFKSIDIPLIHVFIIPVLVSVVGQLGDLSESVFKREFDVKDSGTLLGDHGGVLDRFDSLIFAFPVMYYYLKLFIIQ